MCPADSRPHLGASEQFCKLIELPTHPISSWWSVPCLVVTNTTSQSPRFQAWTALRIYSSFSEPPGRASGALSGSALAGAALPPPVPRERARRASGSQRRRGPEGGARPALSSCGGGWRGLASGRRREGTLQPRESGEESRAQDRRVGEARRASGTAPSESPAPRPRARARSAPAWRTAPQRAARPAALSPACVQ